MVARISVNEREFIDELVEDVVHSAEEVAATLGGGFERDVYERALSRELGLRGRSVRSQASHPVFYKGALVGGYAADLIVAGRLAVDLDCAEQFSSDDLLQCRNYVMASGMQIGLLIRFEGGRVHWEPVVNPEVQSVAAFRG